MERGPRPPRGPRCRDVFVALGVTKTGKDLISKIDSFDKGDSRAGEPLALNAQTETAMVGGELRAYLTICVLYR
jgi:hypothetical protein